ncbi:alpha/beta hydrolase fold protein [Natronococcus amylolyticus DSM 10524]|uniref:Alpha/beta hydrolase fold protein n=1 Tax=Natronococcus amylolyticus DSM 10524 TaxID=1227497 RepID=L9XGQ2_9EURY|nr:alpha/beta fold hydrolase [Natronococcus amylolyticus]ELY60566.1 alpha/beta hydrolase fold protein [Natronococcus amylolyticus DSM 10524]
MELNYRRRGTGEPLLLVHGLGGSWRTWTPILDALAAERDVIAVDLPGHGETPSLSGEVSIDTLATAVTSFLEARDLEGVDVVGNSMGGRLVLELARRGTVGSTVALAPGGFWTGWERYFFYATLAPSIRLVRLLQPVMGRLTASAVGRTLLLAQLSARPWALPADVTREEMRTFADSPAFDELLYRLGFGAGQSGTDSAPGSIVIGWGQEDRVTLPRQAKRALNRFPNAQLYWFEECGHYPHWDAPEETVRLILAGTAGDDSDGS